MRIFLLLLQSAVTWAKFGDKKEKTTHAKNPLPEHDTSKYAKFSIQDRYDLYESMGNIKDWNNFGPKRGVSDLISKICKISSLKFQNVFQENFNLRTCQRLTRWPKNISKIRNFRNKVWFPPMTIFGPKRWISDLIPNICKIFESEIFFGHLVKHGKWQTEFECVGVYVGWNFHEKVSKIETGLFWSKFYKFSE